MPARPIAKRPLPIPKEHGAWAMLGVPFLVGTMVALVAESQNLIGALIPALLLGISVFSLYLARYPVYLWVRFRRGPREHVPWVVGTAMAGLGTGAVLILGWGRWLLIPAGALGLALSLVHLWLVGEHRERSLVGELLGVAGLTLAAPVSAYAASGLWSLKVLALWLVCLLFFGSSVLYVKMRVAAASWGKRNPSFSWGHKALLGWPVLGYHLGGLFLVTILSLEGTLPPLAVIAFLPLALHHGIDVARLSPGINIRRLGFTLFGHSLLFAVLVVTAFWGR